MQGLPRFQDPDLLIGAEHFSDAGVYRLAPDLAIVQTVDFFPPVVDDPFVYGQIAAANSLSDVYAMGARPRTALNIVGFPDQELDLSILNEILRGGAERVLAAGAVIVGGHSVRDAEVKYGLAVTGTVDPSRMLTNERARPGDLLVLTKALGTGFITTANRRGECPVETLAAACESMVALNAAASAAAVELGASAATDITGFGLAGHACEMAEASGVTIEIGLAKLPLLPGAKELAVKANFTRAIASNRGHTEGRTRLDAGAAESAFFPLLYDPQTSGGLLIAIEAGKAGELVQRCRGAGAPFATVIGRVGASDGSRLRIAL